MQINTEWKDIQGYENFYQVNNSAQVRRLYKNRPFKILKPQINSNGYLQVSLCVNSKSKSIKIHRLLAIAFIPNPNNLPCINHIDGNPLNNSLQNLEWCTIRHNVQHAYNIGLHKSSKKQKETASGLAKERIGDKNYNHKKIIDNITGNVFGSIKEAAKSINMKYGTLKSMLQGRNPNRTNFKHLKPEEII